MCVIKCKINLPLWSVVLEVVVTPLKKHPVKVIEGVLEASDIGKVG